MCNNKLSDLGWDDILKCLMIMLTLKYTYKYIYFVVLNIGVLIEDV